MPLYLIINLASVSIPFLFSFHKKLNFYKTWNALFPALLIPLIPFIIWDIYFTDIGIWGFNPDYLIGINLFNLPIEEWMFFITIPYACVFTYASLKIIINKNIFLQLSKIISWLLLIVLLLISVFSTDKLYTTFTFLLTVGILLLHILVLKKEYLGMFYLSYVIIYLFPFLIVNGILTGSFLENPIVWYNNNENLGFRVFTIPIEDFVYGFLLFLSNVTAYEYFLNNFKKKKN